MNLQETLNPVLPKSVSLPVSLKTVASPMRTYAAVVTPEWAAERLAELDKQQQDNLFRQRGARDRAIQRYVQDMKAGAFLLSHQGLAFSGPGVGNNWGNCLDGQNRLWAVVRAGVPVEMNISVNVDPKTMANIDMGSPRDLGSVLQISEGIANAQAREMATFARAIINLTASVLRGSSTKPNYALQISTAEAVYVLKDLDMLRHLERFQALVPTRKARKAAVSAPWAWYHTVRPKNADRLAREYATLEQLPAGSPALALFKYYEQSRRGVHTYEQIYATANAIRAFEQDEQIKNLVPKREALRWLVELNPELGVNIVKRVLA